MMMYQADPEAKPPSVPPYATTGFPVSYHHHSAGTTTTAPPPPPPPAPSAPYSATGSYQTPPPPRPLEDWSTGLCDCFSNVNNCCITCWCPCVTFGQVAEIVDKGSTSCGASGALYTLICCVIGCGCLYSCFYRSKMRRQLNLMGNDCCDCLVHCCCEPCALCQEYRELQHRGFDMVIGWHGNVEQRTRGIAMTMTAPPPPEHAMMTR